MSFAAGTSRIESLPWSLFQMNDDPVSVMAWLDGVREKLPSIGRTSAHDDIVNFLKFLESEQLRGSRWMPVTALAQVFVDREDFAAAAVSPFFREFLMSAAYLPSIRAALEAQVGSVIQVGSSTYTHCSVVLEEQLGSGSFGVVHRAVYNGNQTVAVKVLRPGVCDLTPGSDFAKEAALGKALPSHDNVVPVLGDYLCPFNRLHVVMEYCEPGSVHK